MGLRKDEVEARKRAVALLLATELLTGRGAIAQLAAQARVIADDVLNTTARLDSERSARVAMQEARDRVMAILAKRTERG